MSADVDTEAPEAVDSAWAGGESLRSIVEDLRESAGVESVYGDPIEIGDRTIVPVARVAYGFGGGFGRGQGAEGEGGGVGGGVSAQPAGVVEVAEGGTRFVRYGDRRRAGLALLAGLVLGLLLGRRWRG